MIVSYKKFEKEEHDEGESYIAIFAKLNVFDEASRAFEANCEILHRIKLHTDWIRGGE